MPRIDPDVLEEEWEDAGGIRTRRRRWRRPPAEKLARLPVGRVVALDRGRVTVWLDGRELECAYGGAMRGEDLVVGDDVRVRPPRHRSDVPRVVARLERRTVLWRTPDDHEDEERVVVANADQVAVVIAADYLEGGVGFLDRVLVAAAAGGLEALVVINKIDLGDGEVAEVADRYRRIGYPVRLTSALTGEGVEELRGDLAGRWTVLCGHSGVGKSALYNRLIPDAHHRVGELGRYGGRHTTVRARARPVPGVEGAWLVDTPGVRSFGLGLIEPADLRFCFPELRELRCALDDCTHDGEPGCALPADGGDVIHPARLDSYRRLLHALRGG